MFNIEKKCFEDLPNAFKTSFEALQRHTPCLSYKMELFEKIVYGWNSLTIFTKSSIFRCLTVLWTHLCTAQLNTVWRLFEYWIQIKRRSFSTVNERLFLKILQQMLRSILLFPCNFAAILSVSSSSSSSGTVLKSESGLVVGRISFALS